MLLWYLLSKMLAIMGGHSGCAGVLTTLSATSNESCVIFFFYRQRWQAPWQRRLMINILHGAKQARPQGSKKGATDGGNEEGKINEEPSLFSATQHKLWNADTKNPKEKFQSQHRCLCILRSEERSFRPSPAAGLFNKEEEESRRSWRTSAVNSRRPRPQNSVRAKQQNR